ncbi:hypothetical protein HanIR_Chr01g0041361 [Helianthus annuus]|nr:hypothetical protein HanIR_Chr01g0041361 [Helianthus annuus]
MPSSGSRWEHTACRSSEYVSIVCVRVKHVYGYHVVFEANFDASSTLECQVEWGSQSHFFNQVSIVLVNVWFHFLLHKRIFFFFFLNLHNLKVYFNTLK